MTASRLWLTALLFGAPACLPDDRCDPGFYEDHYACFPVSTIDAGSLDAGTSDAGDDAGGGSAGDPNAVHGKPCTSNAECGGVAPNCGAPMLPVCTSWNCMTGSPCPKGWMCIGIPAAYAVPGVDSACLKL